MAHLALALLGPFQATLDGAPAKGLSSVHLRALLAYLAVESAREHAREALAALLWPERPDREALSALRHALSNLRGALADLRSPGDRQAPFPFLLVTRTSVQFNPDSDHWLDVAEFQDLSRLQDLTGLTRAASLYRGPFLHGLSVGDSPAFEDWLLLKDDEYRREVLSVLGHVTSLRSARGDYGEAVHWARRQLELEPYREQAHRQLMAALALGGERTAALAHYEACRRLLAEELGCEPEDETQALYAQIRDGTLPQPHPSPAILSAAPTSASSAADASPPSRFVAREHELARLRSLLDHAMLSRGGVALISGEAGAGKTALLDEFARQAGQAYGDLIALRGSCNAHSGAGDPYLPFREILQMLAGDVEGKRAGGTLSAEQVQRVWEALPAMGAALTEQGPDLVDRFVPGEALLQRAEGFPGPSSARRWQARLREILQRSQEGAAPVSGMGLGAPAPQVDLFAQVTQVLHVVSLGRPLLLAIDDLQWADSGTAALLFHLGRRLAGSRILLACAFRPEAMEAAPDPKGLGRPLGSVLHELTREWGDVLVDLDQVDGRGFVEAYVDAEPNRLGATFRQALYDHTEGNPLFTIELLRSFERDGTLVRDEAGRWVTAAGPDWERWPPRVEAVITAHMAGLPDEDRALLQTASVQGEQFVAEVAARVLGWDEGPVVRRLSGLLRARHRLVEAVSLERLASSGQRLSRYRFRHALLQRGAYGSLDAIERAQLHETTGQVLEMIYAPEGEPSLAPELARHYEAAGMSLEAVRQRLAAGQWAARLVAYDEAVAHLERGLALLEGIGTSRERLRLELGLWVALVNPALLRGGWGAPAFARALARVSDLTQHPELRGDPQRLAALSVLAMTITWSADPERGRQVGEQLLDLAQDGDLQSLMLAHWALGHSQFWRGQFVAAREHLGHALALYDPDAGRPLSPTMGTEAGVMGRAVLSFVLWLLGYADQGRAGFRQALARAEALEQPPTAAFAHLMAGMTHMLLGRDVLAARSHGCAVDALGEVRRFYDGFVDLLIEQAPTAAVEWAEKLEAGSAWLTVGSGVGQAAYMVGQAQTLARAGQARMGLRVIERAKAWIEDTGVRTLEAEAWRMRGELLLALTPGPSPAEGGEIGEAEACFHRALEIARSQQARWLELRAAVSLARLWGARGRRDQARELLALIYGWFTEGFDTVDLAEAQVLLAELG